MSRVVRELRDEGILEAVALLREWGYYREIEQKEIDGAVWLAYGDDILLWFQLDLDQLLMEIAGVPCRVHVCTDPKSRRRINARPVLYLIEHVAGIMGADALWSSGMPAEHPGFLERLRWIASPLGWYKPLGGDSELAAIPARNESPGGLTHGIEPEAPAEAEARAGQGGRGGGRA